MIFSARMLQLILLSGFFIVAFPTQPAWAQIQINDGSFATDTPLNANSTASGDLLGLANHDGVSFDFSYEVVGTPEWVGGIQFQNPEGLEQLWTQHRNTGFDTNIANFNIDFSAPVDGLSLRHGGLDNLDTVRVEFMFQNQPVVLSTSWFGSFTGGVFVNASTPTSVTLLGPGGPSIDETANEYRITIPSGVPIDEIRFTAAKLNQNNSNVTLAFYDFSWTASAVSMTAQKTLAFLNSDSYALPGTDVIYRLSVTNTGTLPIDADTIFLVDLLPDRLVYFNGDYDGIGPGTTRAGFEETGSGLVFDPATDIGFSASLIPPGNFEDCTYTPLSGYDENIRYICFNPKGAFLNGTPQPEFSISFRAQIR